LPSEPLAGLENPETVRGSDVSQTIFCETTTGEFVSLWEADRGNYRGNAGAVQEEHWHTSWVCVGAHIPSAETPVLSDLRLAADNLYYLLSDGRFCAPQWTQIEGVSQPGEKQDDGTFVLPYVLPVVGGRRANVASGMMAGASYSITTDATAPWVSPATEANPSLKLELMTKRRRSGPRIELTVSAWARLRLQDGSSSSADELLHRAKPLLGLVSLATFDAGGVEWISATTDQGASVSILCRTGNPSFADKQIAAGGIVFTLDDVPLESFLEAWERLTSGKVQAQYAWNVTIGLIGHSALLVEEHVSQVLAAAEGFHTWCINGGMNLELRNRLIRLHDNLSEPVKSFLHLDVERWVDWATWARNHVDHGGIKRHREIQDYYQLKTIADSVRLVTYLAVLQEFDVPTAKVVEALRNHPRISTLAQRCRDIPATPESGQVDIAAEE
jgi:hypothetical protein